MCVRDAFIIDMITEMNKKYFLNIDSQNDDKSIFSEILSLHRENSLYLYNLFITILFRSTDLNYGVINLYEESFYNELNDKQRKFFILESYTKILSTAINEFVRFDIDIQINFKEVFVILNLDSLYNVKLNHLVINERQLSKILSKRKNNEIQIAYKIIINHFVIATLKRDQSLLFYNRGGASSKIIDRKIKEQISFVKGYKICISPDTASILKKYLYDYKTYLKSPVVIQMLEGGTRGNFLLNKNFSYPIWINEQNSENINPDTNDWLQQPFESEKCLKVLNYLNSTKLKIDTNFIHEVHAIARDPKNLDWSMITRHRIIDDIYSKAEKTSVTIYRDAEFPDDYDLKKAVLTAATLELIKMQGYRINRFNQDGIFYIANSLDSRARIYANIWPLNYQLNHVARAAIQIAEYIDLNKTVKIFFESELAQKYLHPNLKYFILHKLTEPTKIKFLQFISTETKLTLDSNDAVESVVIESILMLVCSIIPQEILNLTDKLEYLYKNFKEIMCIDFVKDWKDHRKKYNLKHKNLFKFMLFQHTFRDLGTNLYLSTFWGDASSNAFQLISFRLGYNTNKWLKLLNVYCNDTEFSGIYDYVAQKLRELDHTEILKKLNNLLTIPELLLFITKPDIKATIMPGVYGKTNWAHNQGFDTLWSGNELAPLWLKLNSKEKTELTNYLWENSFDILKKEGFNLSQYQNLFDNSIKPYWINDFGLPILIRNYEVSKRAKYLKQISILSYRIKIAPEGVNINTFEARKKVLKIKLLDDERKFCRRARIQIINENRAITLRINHQPNEVDTKAVRQSLPPSSIHSYDSSIIFEMVKICEELEIKVLTIHDSVGSQLIVASLIKLLFKLVNIKYIEQSTKIVPYPFTNPTESNKFNYGKILESDDFFR